MTRGWFITGTGTGVGKTLVASQLARLLRASGRRVAALKPIETGCNPHPNDALALADACGFPELAHVDGLYRAKLPVSPYAATLAGEPPPPTVPNLAATCSAIACDADVVLIEGAGALLVPIDATQTVADLAVELRLPLLIVARDELGVLATTLATFEAARSRNLVVSAVILNRFASVSDPSLRFNAAILQERLPVPIVHGDSLSTIAAQLSA